MPKKKLKKETDVPKVKKERKKKEEKRTKVDRNILYELERKMVSFLRTKHGGQLWHWSIAVPLVDTRWKSILDASPELLEKLETNNGKLSVLSLGCGFCMHWPLFQEYGVKKFVGVDLFELRNVDTGHDLQKTTQNLVDTFCQKSNTKLFEGDVRNIDELMSKNGKKSKKKFDIVVAATVDYKKLGSTGISKELFDSISDKYLKKNGLAIYVP